MTPEELKEIREILLEHLKELEKGEKSALKTLHTTELAPDPIDLADEERDLGFFSRLKDRENKLKKKILTALKRIEEGTYGYCEICGEPIDFKRLKSRPVTTLCIDCKEEQELKEKMEGRS